MAQRFLDQLPKVPNGQLPNVTECMICREAYGTVPSDNGTIEHAVLLPCLHHVGSECIAIWLSPDNGFGNSCPLCRTVFFPMPVRDYDDEDDDEDDNDGSGDSDSDDDSDPENEDGNEDDGSADSDEEKEESDNGDEGDEHHQESREDGRGSEDQRERVPMTLPDAFQRAASSSASSHSCQETHKEDEQCLTHRRTNRQQQKTRTHGTSPTIHEYLPGKSYLPDRSLATRRPGSQSHTTRLRLSDHDLQRNATVRKTPRSRRPNGAFAVLA